MFLRAIDEPIAVVYLARGADDDRSFAFNRFLASYRACPAGHKHKLYIVYKGFSSQVALDNAREQFAGLGAATIEITDDGFDIGAYLAAADTISEDVICFLNTNSEILSANWLLKLAINLAQPKIGMVGATGSFESLSGMDPRFAIFPNVHLRSNAFMIRRQLLLEIAGEMQFSQKLDAYLFESGPQSLTNEVLRRGLDVQIVGRNGRGYPPRWWPRSETFRRLTQENLLVADNQTRQYMDAVWSLKHALVINTWGPFVDPRVALPA